VARNKETPTATATDRNRAALPEGFTPVFNGRVIALRVERWPAGEREVVHHPGACGVVALTPAGEVVLVRQFREAVRQALLEIPAGIRDQDGEPPAACAARELLEETGYTATGMEPLASILTSPGFADERIELFVAEASDGPQSPATEPEVETVVMPLEDALAAVRDGTIADAKTMVALLLAGQRLRA
jgi:ADP-ribose pyrophosphatase